VDPVELPKTEARLRADGFGPDVFLARQANFAGLAQAMAREGLTAADLVLADLGVSSMQLDDPARGFSYKGVGPLDMRMNPSRGEPASHYLARTDEGTLADVLRDHADEPHAAIIAALLKSGPLATTHAAERVVRLGLSREVPSLSSADVKNSVRRTFQALRIAVNDEFSVLDAFLRVLPLVLAPGGRAAIITFHSGEDRRVKKAFQAGHRDGIYDAVAPEVIRASMAETRANRRASSAKLRWAVRA
jgi:16S rRNA (cytosine1402-N4)-methyltransferase